MWPIVKEFFKLKLEELTQDILPAGLAIIILAVVVTTIFVGVSTLAGYVYHLLGGVTFSKNPSVLVQYVDDGGHFLIIAIVIVGVCTVVCAGIKDLFHWLRRNWEQAKKNVARRGR